MGGKIGLSRGFIDKILHLELIYEIFIATNLHAYRITSIHIQYSRTEINLLHAYIVGPI